VSDHIPTLADVCSAIAEGHLAADSDGNMYQVNALELRRYFTKRYSLPAISFVNAPNSVCADSGQWSSSDLCSLGR